MTGGLLDYVTEASHIAAGIGCTMDEAMEIVKAAHTPRDEPAAPTTIDNVVYGVDFGNRR